MIVWWLACADPVRPEVPLAAMDAWIVGSEDVDPFAAHRGDVAECPVGTVTVEDGALEVDTGLCDYVLLEQPLLADVQAGELVEIVFWHNELAALSPAEAHVAFAIDGSVVVEHTIPIPSLAAAYAETVEITDDVAVGAPLVLHLHNHGANTWNVLRITRLSDSPPP